MPRISESSFLAKVLFALVLVSVVFSPPIGLVAQTGSISPEDRNRKDSRDSCDPRGSRAEPDDGDDDDDVGQEAVVDQRDSRRDRVSIPGQMSKRPLARCELPGSSGGAAKGDFNGDGFADLVIGLPYEDEAFVNGVGAINVIYGSADGLDADGPPRPDQSFDMTDFGLPFQSNSHFGWALAAGNFNVDPGVQYSDLAIGMPDWDSSTVTDFGKVLLIDGSENGLDPSTARELVVSSAGGRIGLSLVWADFNGDTVGDLAIGAPETFVTDCAGLFSFGAAAGAVHVFYGRVTGLTALGKQRFVQGGCNSPAAIGDSAEQGDQFGRALAAGHFNDDGFADLVIGVPLEDLGLFDKIDAGLIHILRGTGSGLQRSSQIISQDTFHDTILDPLFADHTVADVAESGDQFGGVFATLHRSSNHDDLFVGIPFEDVGTRTDAGAVQFFKGGYDSNTSLDGDIISTRSTDAIIDQGDLDGVAAEAIDYMGASLAVGDFDGDGNPDLAIGVHGEDTSSNTIENAGLVTVLYHPVIHGVGLPESERRIGFDRMEHWTQDSNRPDPVPSVSTPQDHFGYALSAWNYGHGAQSDLAIGIPFKDVISASSGTLQVDAGAVIVLYGSASGLTSTGADFWHQDRPNVNGVAQPGDRFGNRLY